MKRVLFVFVLAMALSFVFFTENALAIYGSDDFNDQSWDSDKWDRGVEGSTSNLSETVEGHLGYSSDGTNESAAWYDWILNDAKYEENWSIELDVNMPTFDFTNDQECEVSIFVQDDTDIGDADELFFSLMRYNGPESPDPYTNVSVFFGDIELTNHNSEYHYAFTESTNASLKIEWDVAVETLYCYYDEDGGQDEGDYVELTNWSIGAGDWDWGMNSGDVFLVGIEGCSEGVTITSDDNVWGDNFNAVPEPSALLFSILGLFGLLAAKKKR